MNDFHFDIIGEPIPTNIQLIEARKLESKEHYIVCFAIYPNVQTIGHGQNTCVLREFHI